MVKILSGFILLTIATCCERSFEDTTLLPDSSAIGEELEWQDLVKHLDPEASVIIVQNDAFIQDAIDEAEPGDAVCIEPGHYKEIVSIDKPDIRIIGLGSTMDGPVILENPELEKRSINTTGRHLEIFNIQLQNYFEDDVEISTLGNTENLKCGHRFNVEREDLGNGIAHYMIDMPMGKGEFDMVRIHRVVKECRPYRPIRTKGNIFMVHGASNTFDAIFFIAGAEVINAETSSPFYLASNNIDVWGIDLAWTMVPMETTDFTFMKEWTIERDISHVLKAMSIARLIRRTTRQGFCRLNLLGFSYGVPVVYGGASRETQMHGRCRRNIKGLVPVDNPLKFSPEENDRRMGACNAANNIKAAMETGVYHNSAVGSITIGNLALTAPDDPSPFFSGLTNYQAGLQGGTAGRFIGGDINGLLYTEPARWFRTIATIPPYMPLHLIYDIRACQCDEGDVSFEEHLSEISVPILYIGAAGAAGYSGEYASGLTASKDLEYHTVDIPDTEPGYNYGHADLWLGFDADELVWDELRQWLLDH